MLLKNLSLKKISQFKRKMVKLKNQI